MYYIFQNQQTAKNNLSLYEIVQRTLHVIKSKSEHSNLGLHL